MAEHAWGDRWGDAWGNAWEDPLPLDAWGRLWGNAWGSTWDFETSFDVWGELWGDRWGLAWGGAEAGRSTFQITRLGNYGGPRPRYGSFVGKGQGGGQRLISQKSLVGVGR